MKLEINYNKKNENHSNIWRLNSMLFNNEWVNYEITEEIKNYLETNENDYTTTENLWDTPKPPRQSSQHCLKRQESTK